MKNLVLLSILAVLTVRATAQNISTTNLNWGSVSTFVPTTATTTGEVTQFITYSGDSIRWVGADQTIKYRLKVLETNGTWSDVSQAGTIIYEVDNNGKRGVITMTRSNDIKVRMMLTTDADPAVYELTINSIQTF